ncbi:MAG: hypothetical protein GJ680_14745 [Alteromonadaceae bacterium]|nr:hypothetical protein [Alteromonadaceae bacterium]
MKKNLGFLSTLLALVLGALPVYAGDKVVLWERNYIRPSFYELIELTLELTKDDYGDYQIVSSEPMEQGKAFAMLQREIAINVIIAGTSKKRESQFNTIYYPIDRGLLGFRLCIVTEDNRLDFADINELKDFRHKEKIVGVGTHWPDRSIINDNGLRVEHSQIFEQLFKMVELKRIDCFLRSINEIDGELEKYGSSGLADEPFLAFLYPAADFIFIGKSDTKIAERISEGLRRAIYNGDFERHFEKHYAHLLQKYQFYNRKLLFLKNYDMSAKAKQAINKFGIASFAD